MIQLISELIGSEVISSIEREIFSKENQLFWIIKYLDFNRVLIQFISPEKRKVKKDDEKFQKFFLNELVDYLEKKSPELEVVYNYFEDSKYIESIQLLNINSVEDFNYITSILIELIEKL